MIKLRYGVIVYSFLPDEFKLKGFTYSNGLMGINDLNFFIHYVFFVINFFCLFFSYYLMHSNKRSLSCRWHSRLHKNNDEGRGVRRFVSFLDPTCPIFW